MNKREAKKALRLILGHHIRGCVDCHNSRVEIQAVFFSRRYNVELPAEYNGWPVISPLWERVCSLLYDRRCEGCRTAVIERSVYTATWGERPEACTCD